MMKHINVISPELLEQVSVKIASLDSTDGADAFMEIMNTFGFAVVSDVLSREQVAVAESLFDDDLASIVDLPENERKQHDCFRLVNNGKSVAKRWPNDVFPLGREIEAFASDYGIPQGRCAWYCRLHPGVHRVFEVLNRGCKDLCVGMDNLFFDNHREDHTIPDEERTNHLWPHADQSLHADGGHLDCYQSVVYVWPSSEYTSTTVVWPTSHKTVYQEMMEERAYGQHFCRLPPKYHERFAEGAVRVTIPSGGMIIWNSKLIHQGWNLGPRLAVPICMEPKERRYEAALERKMRACIEGIPTTHWASLGYFHGSMTMRPGGSKKFPLHTNAQRWMLTAEDEIDPTVLALL